MRASLVSLGRRLPEHADDLHAIADGFERDESRAIERARVVAARAMRTLCEEEGIEVEGVELQAMLDALLAKRVIPTTIAAHVQLLHDRDANLAGDSVQALIGFLEWRIGSRRQGVDARPRKRRSRVVVVGAVSVVAVAIVIAIVATRRGPAESPLTGGPMVKISGATFDMGSTANELAAACETHRQQDHRDCLRDKLRLDEEQLRTVTVSAFEIDKTEVTVAAFVEWLERAKREGASWTNITSSGGKLAIVPGMATMPIAGVSWHDARAYCEAVGRRLPTEAEWELAARGPARRIYPWGSAPPQCDRVVFARQERVTQDPVESPSLCVFASSRDAAPVGSAPGDVTPEGVHDLGGNLMEWTSDAGGDRPTCNGPCVDPRAKDHSMRVVRGGGWRGFGYLTRGASRISIEPDTTATDVGFRCARSI